jgi:hypothetical protein
MTIVAERLVDIRPPQAPDQFDIGGRLAEQNWMHFRHVTIPGVGVGLCSCNATVAIQPNRFYTLERYGQFSVVHGNSQIFRGRDIDFAGPIDPSRPFASSAMEEHAEQVAITVAIGQGLPLWSFNGAGHVYIDLGPCPSCWEWLDERAEQFVLYYLMRYADAGPTSLERLHRSILKHFPR